ncbi:hypothetical protein D5S17_24440 [Pseudonocardiaceae bacterium YIM PH 21723]|nr:hypothetical protein D5S17_24440 [Pseudonocardiaceae bacterium YIM PH 21723]
MRRLRSLWPGFGSLDWSEITVLRALRTAIGVVVPLLLGVTTGHLEQGAFAALGALSVGFVSFQGVTRTRITAILLASFGMAVSTFIGATTPDSWLPPVIIAVAYIAGLSVALEPRQTVAVAQWPVALLIAVGLPLSVEDAAIRAALVLAGGLFQGLLVTVTWALRRDDPERVALAQTFDELAVYAGQLAGGHTDPPPPTAFPATARLTDPSPLLRGPARANYDRVLARAEHLRAALATAGLQGASPEFLAAAERALRTVARSLAARRPDHRAIRLRELREQTESLPVPVSTWQWTGEAVRHHLKRVAELLAPRAATDPLTQPLPLGHAARHPLRVAIDPAGDVGRHALRLAVTTGLAELLVQATQIFQGRWVVLTVLLVLRPDYQGTLTRGLHRAVGTAVGAGLGLLIATVLPEGYLTVGIAVLACVAAYSVFEANYLVYSCLLTVFITILLGMLGMNPELTAPARIIDTTVGAVIAVLAYVLWPTWHARTAEETFLRLTDTHGEYVVALLHELANPGQVPTAELRSMERLARRARLDAEASADRVAAEPVHHPPLTPSAVDKIVAAATRLAQAELAAHTLIASPMRPDTVAEVGGAVTAAYEELLRTTAELSVTR